MRANCYLKPCCCHSGERSAGFDRPVARCPKPSPMVCASDKVLGTGAMNENCNGFWNDSVSQCAVLFLRLITIELGLSTSASIRFQTSHLTSFRSFRCSNATILGQTQRA